MKGHTSAPAGGPRVIATGPAIPPVVWLAPLAGIAVSLAYVSGFALGLDWTEGASWPFWPANGVVTAFLLLRPRREWAWYLVSAFVAELLTGGVSAANAGVAIANITESFLCASVFLRLTKGHSRLDRPSAVSRFLAAAALATLVSAVAAGGVNWAFRGVEPNVRDAVYFFVGDLLGLLVVVPAGLVLLAYRRWWVSGRRRAVYYSAAFVAVEVLLSLYVFGRLPPKVFATPLPYLVVPVVVVHTLTFGSAGHGAAVAAVAFTGVAVTPVGEGPFATSGSSLKEQIASLQIFIASLSASVLYLGAYVTARKHAVRRSAALQRSLLQANARISTVRLGAMVGHDVKNLLQVVQAAVDFKEWPAELPDAIGRVNRLLRSFMRVSAGPVGVREFVLDDSLRDMGAMLTRLGDGRVAVNLTLGAKGVRAFGDPLQFELALFVVVQNAIDAMERGGRLALRSFVVDDRVEVSVSDTGTGVSDDVRDTLFDAFSTTKPHGTGFGLYAAKESMEEMGGTLALVATGPTGSTFALRLPVATAR